MKKLRLFLLAGLACMALTACEKDNEEETPGRVKTFGKFVMADTQLFRGEGKVVLDFDGANSKLLYENGDYVKINGEDFRLTKSGSGSSTVWTANGTELTATKFYCAYADGVNTGDVLDNYSGNTYRFNLSNRFGEATNKILLGGVTDSNVLTLRPACAIIRLKANNSYSNVKIGFEANKILGSGTMTIASDAVTISGGADDYLAAVTNAEGTGADFLSMEYNSSGRYWYVAVPVSSSVSTTLYLQWEVGGETVRKKTSGQVTLTKGYVYDMGTERISPFNANACGTYFFYVDNSNHRVTFTAGNLQCQKYLDINFDEQIRWRFAPNQYDVIGNDNGTNMQDENLWFDLFGYGTSNWSASGATAYAPYSTSVDNADYYASNLAGTNADWGVYNRMSPGIYYGTALVQFNKLRTLTEDEWAFLINRSGKSGLVNIAGRFNGLMLLPNTGVNGSGVWSNTSGVDISGLSNSSRLNLSLEDWEKLESIGAIFLPAAGYREGTATNLSNTIGYYWSTIQSSSIESRILYFDATLVSAGAENDVADKYYGCSVRLVANVGSW